MRYFVSYAGQAGNSVPIFGSCEVVRDGPIKTGDVIKLQDDISADLARNALVAPTIIVLNFFELPGV